MNINTSTISLHRIRQNILKNFAFWITRFHVLSSDHCQKISKINIPSINTLILVSLYTYKYIYKIFICISISTHRHFEWYRLDLRPYCIMNNVDTSNICCPRDAVSRTANVERNDGHKWDMYTWMGVCMWRLC